MTSLSLRQSSLLWVIKDPCALKACSWFAMPSWSGALPMILAALMVLVLTRPLARAMAILPAPIIETFMEQILPDKTEARKIRVLFRSNYHRCTLQNHQNWKSIFDAALLQLSSDFCIPGIINYFLWPFNKKSKFADRNLLFSIVFESFPVVQMISIHINDGKFSWISKQIRHSNQFQWSVKKDHQGTRSIFSTSKYHSCHTMQGTRHKSLVSADWKW